MKSHSRTQPLRFISLFCLTLFLLGGSLSVLAQATDPQHNPFSRVRQGRQYGAVSKLKGKVMDATGKPLENVNIRIRDRDQPGQVLVVRTDEKGEFTQGGLNGEYYEVEASLLGYRSQHKVVSYDSGGGTKVTFVMELLKGDAATYAYRNPQEEYEFRISEARVALLGNNAPRAQEIVNKYKDRGAWDPDFQVLEGDLYRLQGDCETALKHYKKAERILGDITHAFLLYAKGECQMIQGDVPGAGESWQRAVRLEPANWNRRIQAGRMMLSAGDTEQARLVLFIETNNPGPKGPREAWQLAWDLCEADSSGDCKSALLAAAQEHGVHFQANPEETAENPAEEAPAAE